MQLINKEDGKFYNIYDIAYDKTGYPLFLFYKDGQWIRKSAKYFEPFSGESICDWIDAIK